MNYNIVNENLQYMLYERKKPMGQKDISEKTLLDYNDVFADIINGIIFKGEQRVHPDTLENMTVHSQYKADGNKLHEQERDVAKYWNENDVRIAIYGFEDESVPEKQMSIRIIGYDGAAYRSQLGAMEICPVVTIVLYFGTKRRWNEPKSLKELMNIPQGMEEYVNDYHINVVEIAWLTEDEIDRFKSDFRIVANFFRQKRLNENYIPDDPTEIKHVDEVLKLLSVMTGDNSYEMEINDIDRGGVSMCTVAQNLLKQGRNEGRNEGINLGENKLAQLINVMVADNKSEDITKVTTDEKLRKEYYKKYNIV
jgi:hypothetical protein